MKKDISEIIGQLEKGVLNEDNSRDKVVVVDSIGEFMRAHRAILLNDLGKSLNVNGEA